MPRDVLCRETFYATRHSMPGDILCHETFYAARHSMPWDILCHETFYAARHSMPQDILCHKTFYARRHYMPRDILCHETFVARHSMPRDLLCQKTFYVVMQVRYMNYCICANTMPLLIRMLAWLKCHCFAQDAMFSSKNRLNKKIMPVYRLTAYTMLVFYLHGYSVAYSFDKYAICIFLSRNWIEYHHKFWNHSSK